MSTHYVYKDPDHELCQGDILRKAPPLLDLIKEFFPYYATNEEYKYFIVLTQTCDDQRQLEFPSNDN